MKERNEHQTFKADEIPSREISDPAVLSNDPLVSVIIVTYNHEPYIAEAIEGALMQKTNFPYEVLIGEDDSSDGTREICKEYAAKHPDRIRLFLNDRKNVIYIGGQPTGRWNFINLLKNSKGKYIALCEGDDYWTDRYKLQKQVDFLEKNSEYSGSAHQAMVIYEKQSKKSHLYRLHVDQDLSINDFLQSRRFHTASFVFRKSIIEKRGLPTDILSADRALFFLSATYGPIRYTDECMCVYRKSDAGISSRVTTEMLKKDLGMIPWLKEIDPNFRTYRYLSFIHATIICNAKIASLREILYHYFMFVLFSFSYFPINTIDIIKFTLKSIPKIVYRRLK